MIIRTMRHSFSTLLILCVLMVAGAALVPRLDIGNEPRPERGSSITISYNWNNTPAKVVEQNVTSRIEALVSSVKGVEKVSSVSRFGSGRITVEMKPQADVAMARFEIVSILRHIRGKLPQEMSYPVISGGEMETALGDDNKPVLLLTYQVNADMPDEQVRCIVDREVRRPVERVEGVQRVEITAAAAHYMEISYDAAEAAAYGITGSDMAEAVKNYAGREDVVGEVYEYGGRVTLPLVLSSKELGRRFEQMPLKSIGGKTVYLNGIASCAIRERKPSSYYRVNGMNTLYVNVYAKGGESVVRVAGGVRKALDRLGKASFFNSHASLSYDRAEVQMREFHTLVLRTAMTLSILLLLVWLAGGRRWRYLCVITVALAANVLIAVLAYWTLDIRLHPVSMVGITVSLGIIIDSTIVMADHYGYYRNRSVFIGVLGAMLTTIGALAIVFWLPDFLRHDLRDFAVVVMINLAVAIVVALLFVPALVDRLHLYSRRPIVRRTLWTRCMVTLGRGYRSYVTLSQHRWARWALLLLFAGVFAWSLILFVGTLDYNTYRPRDKGEMRLNIRAEMPVGGSVQELNEKVMEVEAFLSQFSEIKRYETYVRARGATIVVEFKQEALDTGFPYVLENRVIGKVITIGGADWATCGVSERGFSNSLNLQYRSNSIEISGYDYERLYRFAEDMCRDMRRNSRVVDLAVVTPGHEEQENEFYMEYDRRALAQDSVSAVSIYASIRNILAEREVDKIELPAYGRLEATVLPVEVRPLTAGTFDIWQLRNSYINAGGNTVRTSAYMSINERMAKNVIPRDNQEYVLRVAFNMLASYTYTDKYIKRITEHYNSIFPVGFRCVDKRSGAYDDKGTQYWLIGLVAVIIFFITAILFESLMQALAITLLIPVSLSGLFITYYLTGVPFGTGGFAAMVLLAGVTVNAAIYIVRQYNVMYSSPFRSHDSAISKDKNRSRVLAVRHYVAAFNHKFNPILLTILSTVLGMVPFLIDGPEEQPFWYSLAAGTIGGLALSIIPLIFFLPPVLRLHRSCLCCQSSSISCRCSSSSE